MSTRPIALGYLRRDVSGVSQVWDETQIRSLAKRFGYELAKTVTFGPDTAERMAKLVAAVRRAAAEAVFVPNVEHFDGGRVPAELVRLCDVTTISPEYTHARWAIPLGGPAPEPG
ncbi:hypothetical protein D5S18_20580 [Nocardia panacis]|uniref:Recombinase family protein n=1 Tax=Nocardia panacis TaxID=2340916 RepID=A0A3A4KIT1_9NOCA|nr:hypothetical protein [Nocardia panacis]RJO73593.1 hypothetical protein D5S18_20580 [Nocardia panacis]